VRAADGERSKDSLVFGGMGADKDTLTYLKGELPGDRGCAATLAEQMQSCLLWPARRVPANSPYLARTAALTRWAC
jgi:hypothetical protein